MQQIEVKLQIFRFKMIKRSLLVDVILNMVNTNRGLFMQNYKFVRPVRIFSFHYISRYMTSSYRRKGDKGRQEKLRTHGSYKQTY